MKQERNSRVRWSAWLDANMKTIKDQLTLNGKIETITAGELRQQPGEVLESVALGKTFVVTKRGSPIAVISKPPGQTLTINVGGSGEITYSI